MAHSRPPKDQETTLGALIDGGLLELGDGYRAKNEELGGGGLVFLRSGHLTESGFDFGGVDLFRTTDEATFGRKIAQAGDVVVTTKGWSTGRVAYVLPDHPRFVYSPHLSYWRSLNHSAIAPAFLRQWSRSPECQQQLDSIKMGIDIHPYLSLDTQRRLRISIPDIRVQDAVADVLGALDDKIELTRRMNETLEAMARGLFKAWFVDFDPARADADQMIAAGVLEIGDGYRAKNSELGPPGLPFIRAGDLNSGFDTVGADVLNEANVPKARNKVSRPGDVAFTSKGTVGRFARVTLHTQPFVYSPQVCFWRSLDERRLDPTILYCWMQDDDFRRQVSAVAGQTDMAPYVSLRDQRRMKVPVFPVSQHAAADQIRPLFEHQAVLAAEAKTLASLRDLLLPKLLSGELRVRDADRIVERAV